jgi:hypothetical protein
MIECVEDTNAPHGVSIYIVIHGVRIARRGDPDTPQARTWVPLEPGWAAYDLDYVEGRGPSGITIEYNGVPVQ